MELKQRKNLRLQSFDYSSAKYYFVTICTKNRARLFGQIVGNGLDRSAAMELSSLGKTAEKMLLEVPVHFTSTALDAYVIMPNHIHYILAIGCNELSERSRPFPTLPTIIGQYKSGVSRAAGSPYGKNPTTTILFATTLTMRKSGFIFNKIPRNG